MLELHSLFHLIYGKSLDKINRSSEIVLFMSQRVLYYQITKYPYLKYKRKDNYFETDPKVSFEIFRVGVPSTYIYIYYKTLYINITER